VGPAATSPGLGSMGLMRMDVGVDGHGLIRYSAGEHGVNCHVTGTERGVEQCGFGADV